MCRANEKWGGQFLENFDVRLNVSHSYLQQQENVRIVSCAKQSVSDATTKACGQQVFCNSVKQHISCYIGKEL